MIGLYVHIPFCKKKCNYCDFLSFPTKEHEAYLDALCAQIDFVLEKNPELEKVDTIFMGGGTPSILSNDLMKKIMKKIHSSFDLSELLEFSIECNPCTLDEEKLEVYKEFSVNRLSLGLQSTNDEELKILGRIHDYNTFLKSYECAKKLGFENINIDVMSAIPGQTLKSYEKTLKDILALSPSHISSYSLILEEGTYFYEKYKDKPPIDEETDRLMYDMTKNILEDAGFHRYEISNYAKKNFECIHNKKYWQRKDYLGIGLGASSCIGNKRFSNITNLKNYIDKAKNKESLTDKESIEILEKKDEMAEFIYLGLRLMEGISKRQFFENFNEDIMLIYGKKIDKHIKNGLLQEKDDKIMLTKKGIDVSNMVFVDFI